MKFAWKSLCFLCVLCGASSCFSLDREAFSITNYDLILQIDPQQHRLGARGKITLRNDTAAPQKIAILQISSSLDWRAIRAGDKMLQFITQSYTSDIDHTGALSEAIVTLPREIASGGTFDIDIAYEGVVLLDATRLTRIGTPEEVAANSDWDRIDESFAALRGAGYVAWYPIATEVANLSEGDTLFAVLTRWRKRESGVRMKVSFPGPISDSNTAVLLCSGRQSQSIMHVDNPKSPATECSYDGTADPTPSFVFASYGVVSRPSITVYNLATHAVAAEAYASASEKIAPLIRDWFGPQREAAKIGDLPELAAAPFESGAFLFTPLTDPKAAGIGLAVAHQLVHSSFRSERPWINEGLAHFAQAVYLEQQRGRPGALDYLTMHQGALKPTESSGDSVEQSRGALVSTHNEELYRSKAMCVWWMLRDLIGDAALKKAIASYKPEQDNDANYMPRVISAQTQRDLAWFFDDWLYNDHGLPDFKVDSAYAASTPTKSFMLTITIENVGTAGAEVPVEIKFATGEITKRVEVRAKSRLTFRVETPAKPEEIRVNDGSVPEIDLTNNAFKLANP